MVAPGCRPALALFLIFVLLLVGCRGNLGVPQGTAAIPTHTPTLVVPPTPTPPPIRTDCDAIEASGEFLHETEQEWFLANCLEGPQSLRSYDERRGIGKRVVEVFSIDEEICRTGLAGLTVVHEPDLELFSYLFRNFCADVNPTLLAFTPPPFVCAEPDVIEAVQVEMPWLPGFVRKETELFCSPPQDPTRPAPEEATRGAAG